MKHSKKTKRKKNTQPFTYLDVSLNFDANIENIEEKTFEAAIKLALKSLHGETGLALVFEILYYEDCEKRGFIKVASEYLVKIWSAMTLFSVFLNQECVFRVHQVETSVMDLKINSSLIRKLVAEKNEELIEQT